MAWTTPRTWVSGEIVTAAIMNQHVRDNLGYLHGDAGTISLAALVDATTLAVATKQKAGAPVDGDWAAAPPNGTLVVDSTNNKIWARVGGTWKGVVIA